MPRTRKQYKTIHIRHDMAGNAIKVTEEPVYGTRKVYVMLVSEVKHNDSGERLIGEIDRNNRIIFMKRVWSKHYHYQMRAFGFNWTVMHESEQFDNVLLQIKMDGDYFEYYMIPRKFILDYGDKKNFSKSGFELQIFLKFDYFERFKTNKRFERSKLVEL